MSKKTQKSVSNYADPIIRVHKLSEFSTITKKETGILKGSIVNERSTGTLVMSKEFCKDINVDLSKVIGWMPVPLYSTLSTANYALVKGLYAARRDNVQELLAANLYKGLLSEGAPNIILIVHDDLNNNVLHIGSILFNNAVTFWEFTAGNDKSINPKSGELRKIIGFEKVIAAGVMLGESECSPGNLMVNQESGVKQYEMLKIDHGRSFMRSPQNFLQLTENLLYQFSQYGYLKAIESGNLSFNIRKFSEAINKMVNNWKPQEVNNVINKVVNMLEDHGFNPQDFYLDYEFWGNPGKKLDSFSELRDRYKNWLYKHIANIQNIAKDIEVISLFNDDDLQTKNLKNFKNGMWVKEINSNNPLLFAMRNNIRIGDKRAQDCLPILKHSTNIRESNIITKLSAVKTKASWRR